MPLTIPSREDLHTEFVADYSSAQPRKNTSRGSDPYRLGRVVSGVAWSVLARLYYFSKQMLPDTADDYLPRWGAVFGVPQLGAAPSSGAAALAVIGTTGGTVPTNAQLTHADGTIYKVTAGGAVGAGSTANFSVSAVSTGSQTNKVAGEVLTFSAPPAGISATASLVADMTGGLDIEPVEAWRARLLERIANPPAGGTITDYQQWALAVPGVRSAYVYKGRRGPGTIDVAVLGDGSGSERIITDLWPVQTAIDAKRPAGMKDFLVLTAYAQPLNVSLKIATDPTRYKWDWDDLGVGYVITAADSVASTITVPTAPAAVTVGVRLTLNGGEEAFVTARTGNVLTVAFTFPKTWFASSPVVGVDTIRASGDLVVPVQEAVAAVFDSLGPARTLADGATTAATTWEDTVRVAKLLTVAEGTTGVVDSQLVTPTANVQPVDPGDTTVPFLTAGHIYVVKMS